MTRPWRELSDDEKQAIMVTYRQLGGEASVPCPYCDGEAKLTRNDALYPHRGDLWLDRHGGVRWSWRCEPCDAHVGCHEGTKRPLGRLADQKLRAAKMRAHAEFDPLWKAKVERQGLSKNRARAAGYKWLASQLGIEASECHIGMFDVETCNRVVEVCRPWTRRL